MMGSIGEVTNTKFLPLYTQIIIHGSFSRLGMYCATKGRITSKMPAIIRDYAYECWDRFLGAGLLLFVGR
jgi:hypothetical protein